MTLLELGSCGWRGSGGTGGGEGGGGGGGAGGGGGRGARVLPIEHARTFGGRPVACREFYMAGIIISMLVSLL